ncbi:hypothetical protein MP228_010234 [Amoeboaphelidium protococcarum]|nr:hypothetical protein MP228_010234 [Amoeboaphelidium protococcarum]
MSQAQDDFMESSAGQSQMDLHELSTLFPFKPVEQNDLALQVQLTSLLIRQINDYVVISLDEKYPSTPPTINLTADIVSKFIRSHDGLIMAESQTHQVNIKNIQGKEWTEDDSAVDLITKLNTRIHALMTPPNDPVIIDYAYPSHYREHLGVYSMPVNHKLQKLVVEYDFEAVDENELSVSIGDEIEVLFERADGWVVALSHGMTGLVPKNHLKVEQSISNGTAET